MLLDFFLSSKENHRTNFSIAVACVRFSKTRNCAAEKASKSLGFFLLVPLPGHDRNASPHESREPERPAEPQTAFFLTEGDRRGQETNCGLITPERAHHVELDDESQEHFLSLLPPFRQFQRPRRLMSRWWCFPAPAVAHFQIFHVQIWTRHFIDFNL